MYYHSKLPISSKQLLKQLDEWNIVYKHFTHKPLISVNESKIIQEKLFGINKDNGHIKNLYLRDKKKIEEWFQKEATHLYHLASVVGVQNYMDDPIALIDIVVVDNQPMLAMQAVRIYSINRVQVKHY